MERTGNSFDALVASFLVQMGLVAEWYSFSCDHATRALIEWAALRFSLSEREWGGVRRVIVGCPGDNGISLPNN